MQKSIRTSWDDRLFYLVITLITGILFISVCYPLLFILAASLSSPQAIYAGRVFIWPVGLNLSAYRLVFANKDIFTGLFNTIEYTALGTVINVSMVMVAAYPLARSELPGRKFLMVVFTVTMYFHGGLIPSYLLVQKLGLIDTAWALVLPGALPVYRMIVARTFLQVNVPQDLLQASQIDGCNDFSFFFRIVLPLSKAILAVTALFAAVGHWNAYFSAMLYINTRSKVPLTLILRDILVQSNFMLSAAQTQMLDPEMAEATQRAAEVMKYALIVVTTVPMLAMYPFAQKYFMKGVLVGSLKG